jgi:uncharacterized protein YejL (UPF0352 family)
MPVLTDSIEQFVYLESLANIVTVLEKGKQKTDQRLIELGKETEEVTRSFDVINTWEVKSSFAYAMATVESKGRRVRGSKGRFEKEASDHRNSIAYSIELKPCLRSIAKSSIRDIQRYFTGIRHAFCESYCATII